MESRINEPGQLPHGLPPYSCPRPLILDISRSFKSFDPNMSRLFDNLCFQAHQYLRYPGPLLFDKFEASFC